MSLYIVVHPNPYFPRGKYVETIGAGMVQETVMTSEGPSGYVGLVVPFEKVRPFTIAILKRGLDFRRGGALG